MDAPSKVIARIVGAVLLLIGIGMGALAAIAVERRPTLTGAIEFWDWIGIGVFVAVGFVFALMGFRLVANKPNKFGSILSPFAWYCVSAVFIGLGIFFVVTALKERNPKIVGGFVFAGFMAWWCWLAARRARINGITTPPDTPFGPSQGSRDGYFKLVTLKGIPIFVHRSLPMGGVLFAIYAGFDAGNIVYYCLGYFLLVAAHEAGHAVAARMLGLKVFSIDTSGVGGLCHVEVPRKVAHGIIVYSAGMAVQLVLLAITLAYVAVNGTPSTDFGKSLFTTFTIANLIVLFFNVIPMRGSSGLATDGKVLWQLFLHAYDKKRPYPFENYIAASSDQSPIFPPETSLLTIPSLVPKDFQQGVEILNDSTTPMEFVVACLSNHLGLREQDAVTTMIGIHNKGGILIPLPSLEHANEVASAITTEEKERGYAFTCRVVTAIRNDN